MITQLNVPALHTTALKILLILFTENSTLHANLQHCGTRYFYYCNWNVQRLGLRQTCLAPAVPQPTLRCERLAGAATGFSSIRPAASKQSANTLSRWLPQHPIRTDLRPKVLLAVRYNESPAIDWSMWNATNPFQPYSAIGCSVRHVINPFQPYSAIGCSMWYAKSHFSVNIPGCHSVQMPPFSPRHCTLLSGSNC